MSKYLRLKRLILLRKTKQLLLQKSDRQQNEDRNREDERE
jgi:hypothetical protein